MSDLTVLDGLIIGRVEPHIYAFSTNTVPNYLKVGDTYRPVSVRLREWKQHFPDLRQEYESSAKLSDEAYFRDYSVHDFLENEKGKARLAPEELSPNIYYSNEFFKETSPSDVDEAITDIKNNFAAKTPKYLFYDPIMHLPQTYTYERTQTFPPRDNQQKVIDNFKAAISAGRTNLLMYAVMRFGKSFTSMCCAAEMGARLVVIVSAKADVKTEWKKTVESHVRFKAYKFIDGDGLRRKHIITQTLDGGENIVVFLTLQDLQGKRIKDRHEEIFGQPIDLLLIDETHFGARAEKYGEVLKSSGYIKDTENELDSDDFIH